MRINIAEFEIHLRSFHQEPITLWLMVKRRTFWFTSAYDAISFVNYQQGITRDLALMGYAQSTESEVRFILMHIAGASETALVVYKRG